MVRTATDPWRAGLTKTFFPDEGLRRRATVKHDATYSEAKGDTDHRREVFLCGAGDKDVYDAPGASVTMQDMAQWTARWPRSMATSKFTVRACSVVRYYNVILCTQIATFYHLYSITVPGTPKFITLVSCTHAWIAHDNIFSAPDTFHVFAKHAANLRSRLPRKSFDINAPDVDYRGRALT